MFGLDAKLRGRYGQYKLNVDADISSFDPADILGSSRYWGSFGRDIDLGSLGVLSTNLFGAYRYRSWNGSLGETDINAAYGVYAQTKGSWSIGRSTTTTSFAAPLAITTPTASKATAVCSVGGAACSPPSPARFPC